MGASDGSHLLGEATGLGGEGRAKEQVDQTDRALNLRTRTPPGRIPNTSDGRKQEAGSRLGLSGCWSPFNPPFPALHRLHSSCWGP